MKVEKGIRLGPAFVPYTFCDIEVKAGDRCKDFWEEVCKCFDEHIVSITVKMEGEEQTLKLYPPLDWEENRDKYYKNLRI